LSGLWKAAEIERSIGNEIERRLKAAEKWAGLGRSQAAFETGIWSYHILADLRLFDR
jgi:hypothetical protein